MQLVVAVVAMIAVIRIVLDQDAVTPCRDRSALTIVRLKQLLELQAHADTNLAFDRLLGAPRSVAWGVSRLPSFRLIVEASGRLRPYTCACPPRVWGEICQSGVLLLHRQRGTAERFDQRAQNRLVPLAGLGQPAEFRLTMSITVFLLKPTLRAMSR